MRPVAWGLVVAQLAACAGRAPAAAPAPPGESARREAITALAGSQRGPLLNETDIQDVVRGLEAIRVHNPLLRHVGASDPGVELTLSDDAAARLPGSAGRDTVVASTGIASIDSLGRELGVSAVSISRRYVAILNPRFTRPVDAVRELYEALPEVRLEMPILLDEAYADIRARFADGVIHLHFAAGWGDCMAGCIERHTWHYTWDPRTGRVRMVSEAGDPVERWISPRPAG